MHAVKFKLRFEGVLNDGLEFVSLRIAGIFVVICINANGHIVSTIGQPGGRPGNRIGLAERAWE